ncbi:MAG: LPS export ABC transporter permease LptF [Gammaproteobacteria bacterium]|nr:LPS export ABC transporter permease LptF [Gammaproteobacteria bacterium]MDD9895193.1 LPS export ABC transporter permease LptF [Gammaproteobacteria bacterium]MDD9958357.1 LPS export ABC transporter permease LptF [Gammaproteobacteria bacterium]
MFWTCNSLIIFRYLSKQILQVMTAVTLILLVVGLTSRFIQYLGQAVAGELASDVLLLLMFYRLPDFFLVIVPLAFFLGILLAYGRMYAENEMVVLLGSGFSQRRLLLLTFLTSAVVVIFMAAISLSIAPWGVRNTEQLKQNQEQLTEIDLIVAGQFQSFSDGGRVTYAEQANSLPEIGRQLGNVFVALSTGSGQDDLSLTDSNSESPRILLAESARPVIDEETGARFMRLENVYQYDGNPGQGEFSIAQFDVQSILLPEPTEFEEILEEESLGTLELIGSNLPEHQAELQWRLSIILLIPVITLIAVPMSKVDPRQGRYSKLIPAALIYATYFLLLQFSRDLVAEAALNAVIGMWWVHALFIAIGFVLFRYPHSGRYLSLGRTT